MKFHESPSEPAEKGANVTLGIPRLREIIQTASRMNVETKQIGGWPGADEISKLWVEAIVDFRQLAQ